MDSETVGKRLNFAFAHAAWSDLPGIIHFCAENYIYNLADEITDDELAFRLGRLTLPALYAEFRAAVN